MDQHGCAVRLPRHLPPGELIEEPAGHRVTIVQQLRHADGRSERGDLPAAVVTHAAVRGEIAEHGACGRTARSNARRIRQQFDAWRREQPIADEVAQRKHSRPKWLAMDGVRIAIR
jgi:hypothetical protein